MVKYEYRVVKGFTLVSDHNGKLRVAKDEEEIKRGSTFRQDSNYIDYEFSDRGIEQGEITSKLLKKKYITLINKS